MAFLTKQGVQNFNEAFLSTMDRERKLKEQREQFDREMGFRRRQLDLLDAYRQKQVEVSEGHLEAREESNLLNREIFEWEKNKPVETEPLESATVEFMPGIGYVEKKTRGDVPYDFNLLKGLTSGSGEKKEKTPYYDLSKSGDLISKYQDIENAKRIPDTEEDKTLRGQYQYMTKEGAGVTLTPEQKSELKRRIMDDIVLTTDDEARKINSKVNGFYKTFQGFLNMGLSPDQIDAEVNKYLKEASSETRDAMKTLLKRRIF